MPSEEVTCDICQKKCKSTRGLRRHKTMKHSTARPTGDTTEQTESDGGSTAAAESKLHPLQLKKIVETCARKLSVDECYPQEIQDEFKGYKYTLADALFSFEFLKDPLEKFNGDAEKFLPLIYRSFSGDELIFKNLSRSAALTLGLEVSNHILAHINNCNSFEDPSNLRETKRFSEREHTIMNYLSGYILGTFYRRIRQSKKWQSPISQQWLSILIAGKKAYNIEEKHKTDALIEAKNRGGLWHVVPEIKNIFEVTESKFRSYIASRKLNIDSSCLVSSVIKDSLVMANYFQVLRMANTHVSKEIALNLLEHLILLYVRVRTFSYAKDKVKQHKLDRQKVKKKSLRTELKKMSKNPGSTTE